ncbi:MAG: DUF4351 domain-containing protein [Pseudanabaenaceae cyanobacterium]
MSALPIDRLEELGEALLDFTTIDWKQRERIKG